MKRKKISWISPDCFIDVDLPIVNQLAQRYDIDWQIIMDKNSTIDYESYTKAGLTGVNNVNVSFHYLSHRYRSPKNIKDIIKIIKRAKHFNPNWYYISAAIHPYGFILYRLLLPIKNVVVACHNVSTPKGATNERLAHILTNLWIHTFKNIQVFSQSQKDVLNQKVKGKNVLMSHLAIKDYGEPSKINEEGNNIIRFLNFGNIVTYKRVDLLIKAANILYERGYNNFRVRIAGNCRENWENIYAPLIKYPDIFELMIERIPNEDVANLFVDSDVFVMPYQDIAQSGAITVAFRYNVVTLVSDIQPFKEFVQDGKTGITFKSENEIDLADKMQWCIENRNTLKEIANNQAHFVKTEFSLNSIVSKYIDFFESL